MDNIGYRDVTFREADGTRKVVRVPTVEIPEGFYDRTYAEWLKQSDPAGYAEFMHCVEESFIALL